MSMPISAKMPQGRGAMPATAVPHRLADLPDLLRKSEGWDDLRAALRAGNGGTLDGAWGSTASLAAACLGLEAPRTTLIVLAHPGDINAWADEVAGFAQQRPQIFPAEEGTSRDGVNQEAGQRLRLLQQLQSESPPRFLLAAIGALIQPAPDKAELARRSRSLRVGDAVDLEGLSAWLVAHGYRRVDAVEYPAEFSRRGGIVDIFSPDADAPARLELLGDEVESIRRFSAQTQRSLEHLSSIAILGLQKDDGQEVRSTSS